MWQSRSGLVNYELFFLTVRGLLSMVLIILTLCVGCILMASYLMSLAIVVLACGLRSFFQRLWTAVGGPSLLERPKGRTTSTK